MGVSVSKLRELMDKEAKHAKSMGLQIVRQAWVTEPNWTDYIYEKCYHSK